MSFPERVGRAFRSAAARIAHALRSVRRPQLTARAAVVLVLVAAAVISGVVYGSVQLATSGHHAEAKPRSTPRLLVNDHQITQNGVTAGWVKAENEKPGNRGWNLTNTTNQAPGAIEGYADHVSAVQGENVTLFVSTVAPTFHVEAYRMGWYGGDGGRLVWRSPEQPGTKQAAPTISPGANMVEAHWTPSLSVTMTPAWPPGDYLFKLVGSGNLQSRVPLTVRDDASTAAYVIQNSVTTWQAYNLWGGYDLYEGRTGRNGTSFETRAKVVSFDRPYEMNGGSGDFMGNEFPLISLAESLGLDVTYWTDVDLHEHPERALQHKAIISLGHDEYYSSAMRNGLTRARDAGVNIAFLGPNAV